MGAFREQRYNGRTYIIFKGNPRLRRIFKGTRYRADNPKLVSLAIGRLGLEESRRKGGKLTIILLTPVNIATYLTDDEKTMGWLAGTTGTDLVKVGIAGVLATAAGVYTTKVMGYVTLGVVVTAAVGVVSSHLLDEADRSIGLTDKLIEEMEVTLEQVSRKSDTFFVDAANLPCDIHTRSRRALDEAIDSFAREVGDRLRKGATDLMRRFIRDKLYPGWFYSATRKVDLGNERIL